MKKHQLRAFLAALLQSATSFSLAYAATTPKIAEPLVKLDYGSFQGTKDGDVVKFLGMPFAAPPVGELRFAPPQPPVPFSGIHNATSYGLACPQQFANLTVPPSFGVPPDIVSIFNFPRVAASEDCLFINVVKPASVKDHKNLPVIFWIFGGGFEEGDTSFNPGDSIVNRSIALNEPVIYVSANYRLNAFGFLGGKEALAAGAANVGLKDQRFALNWVQKYIHQFGGDPEKVTIWGVSAGAISVGLHLLLNDGNTEGLFRGAIMESGSPFPLDHITDSQPIYDQLVNDTSCGNSSDTFKCLRDAPFDILVAAINKTPSLSGFTSLQLAYKPTIDGELIPRNTFTSIDAGLYAKVPIMSGDVDDEATLFALASLNVTTEQEFRDYVSTVNLPGISPEDLDAIANAYPSDVTKGSPFGTGSNNAITPQYKRSAAFQGDVFFQAPRRFFIQAAAKTQPTFGWLNKRSKSTPFVGSFHGSDVTEFYGLEPDFIGVDALVNFVNNLDPNVPKHNNSILSSTHWPLYNSSSPPVLFTFVDPAPGVQITNDDFREMEMELLTDISRKVHPA